MMETNMLARPGASRAVYLEACHDGVNPQTMVRAVVWSAGRMTEHRQLFDTLDEALAYAQSLCPRKH